MSKKLKPKYLFGKKINFTAKYWGRGFYDSRVLSKLNLVDKLCLESDLENLDNDRSDYIKIYLIKTLGTGLIIGQTTKKEGDYNEAENLGRSDFGGDEWESPRFSVKKSIPFWKVAVGFNNVVLVPKGEYCQIEGVDYGV